MVGLRDFVASHTEMSSAKGQPQQGFADVPTSLNVGNYEMKDYYTDRPEDHGVANTSPYYTPYLGLRARLSQVWINRWTILLVLILCRVLLAVRDLNDDIAAARLQALSACSGVESMGSAMASMPHYMSAGVNELAASGVTKAVNGLMDMLMLTVTAVEQLVLFVINMMTSTYVCLITFAVTGSLHAAIKGIEEVGQFMNKTIGSLTGDIETTVKSFQDKLNGLTDALNSVPDFFGSSKTIPTLDISGSLSKLNTIQIDPTQMNADLNALDAKLPTFDQVHNFTNTALSTPFEMIKTLINESLVAYSFDRSVFPVAEKQQLSFCSDNNGINDFFTSLTALAARAKLIFIVVVSILAVLVCIPMAWIEIRRWRTMKQRSLLLQKHAFDPMDVVYIASRPYTANTGITIASKFKSTRRQILVRWFVAYATSIPALFVLALGVAGLFACLCQYALLKAIEKEVPALANQVGDFAGTVVRALDNASTAWADSANGVLLSTNTKVNNDVFGWVNTSTTAINNTLDTFVTEMSDALNVTFGNTILYDPIKEVLNCLIGLKIQAVQQGLTWAQEHAQVTFPQFNKTIFSLGAVASLTDTKADDSFLASPGSQATDDITNAVVSMANKIAKAIWEEAIISACVVGVWFLMALIGLIRALFAMAGREKTRGEGGPVGFTGDRRAPISPRSPNRNENKFPDFGGPVSSVRIKESNDGLYGANATASGANGDGYDEKLGHVGHRSVESSVQKQGHDRVSSYGYLSGEGQNEHPHRKN